MNNDDNTISQPSIPLPSVPPSSVQPTKEKEFKHVQLKLLAPVATWSWVLAADQCSICRNTLMTICMKCQASTAQDSGCAVVWGTCGHAFHSHCIAEWTRTRYVCPIDESPWSLKQRSLIQWWCCSHLSKVQAGYNILLHCAILIIAKFALWEYVCIILVVLLLIIDYSLNTTNVLNKAI